MMRDAPPHYDHLCEPVGVLNEPVVGAQKRHITVCGYKRKSDSSVAGDGSDLFLSFVAVLCHTLKSGNGNGQQLDNNLCGDVGRYGKSEQSRLAECIAGEPVQVFEYRTCKGVTAGKK